MKSLRRDTQLIIALDVTNRKSAILISGQVSGQVDAIKIGYPLVLSTGLEIINDLCTIAPVIADFKVADIPNTNRLICGQVFEAGANGVIVHGFTGRDSVSECINAAREYNSDIFVVTEMSHPGAIDFMQEKALDLASLAVECGASGVVAPATRPDRVKKIRNIVGDLTIISPGVGAQGGKASDAILAGADYIIVGRRIYDSKTPGIEAERIVKEIEECR